MSMTPTSRIVVRPMPHRLWQVRDSLEPQTASEYRTCDDALDHARGLAADRLLSVVELIGRNGQVELRERFVRGDDGELSIERI
jgi:hypothetical protein